MLTVPVPSRNANGRPAPSRNEGPVGSLRLPQRARRPRPLQVKDEGAPLALPSHWDVESPRGRFQEVIARNIHKVQTSKVVPAVNSRETVDSSGPSAIKQVCFPSPNGPSTSQHAPHVYFCPAEETLSGTFFVSTVILKSMFTACDRPISSTPNMGHRNYGVLSASVHTFGEIAITCPGLRRYPCRSRASSPPGPVRALWRSAAA